MIYKGDDTTAFDSKFITIELDNPNNLTIKKAIFVSGKIRKEFDNPVFPLEIGLNSQETKLLNYQNDCYLAVFDEYGRKQTCEGCLYFDAQKEVVSE